MHAPAVRAGTIYFLSVFAVGFLLGTLRVLVVEPMFGATAAVLVEVPLMLAVAWLAASGIAAWLQVPAAAGPRLTMGAVGLALLMLAELALGAAVGRPPATATPAGWIGLAGQVGFGLIPALQCLRSGRRRG